MADEEDLCRLLTELITSNQTPEAVCTDHPELLPRLRQQWRRVRATVEQLDEMFPSSDAMHTHIRALVSEVELPQIQGYAVESVLGYGGMGVVYKARHLALNRPVALKTVLSGAFASGPERQRLLREAQAVAALHHPNIVTIYNVGECESKPFFTMELLEGPNLAQRLAGMPQPARDAASTVAILAKAVQTAHQSGIVHRDLKPSNVLVAADGSLKITDFGLARHFEGEAALTFTGAQVGTPSYMAPEQARGRSYALGPGVDIYSLGALLYEILTGRPPFRAETALETQRQVLQDEPVPPSRLNSKVPRDLETICLKCLNKDPKRRYATAAALADDLDRFLKCQPILARPLGPVARLGRWCRRNPAAVTIAVLLTMGGVISTWQAAHARWANQETNKRLGQVKKANELLVSIFENLDPKQIAEADRPLQAILAEKIDKAVQQLAENSIGEPLVVANMQEKLGHSLVALGEPRKALVLLERAYVTRLAIQGLEHRDTLGNMDCQAEAYSADGQMDKALRLEEKACQLLRAKFPGDPVTATCMSNLGHFYYKTGRPNEALPLQEENLKQRKVALGADHTDTLVSMHNLGITYLKLGKVDDAVTLFDETLKRRNATLGPYHPHTLSCMNSLAAAYEAAGKLDQSLPLLEKVLNLKRTTLGPDHPGTLYSINALASGYRKASQLDKALPLLEATLFHRRAKLQPDHPDTLNSMNELATAYLEEGKLEQALPLFEEALKIRKVSLGPDHPDTLRSMNNLAATYRRAGRLDEALPLLKETLVKTSTKLGPNDPLTLTSMENMAAAYMGAKESEKALPLFSTMIAGHKARLGADNLELARIESATGLYLLNAGQPAAAEPMLRECLAIREKALPDSWQTFNAQAMLGRALVEQKKYEQARSLLVSGYEGMKAREAQMPTAARPRLIEAADRLVQLYEATNEMTELTKWRKELKALRSEEATTKPSP